MTERVFLTKSGTANIACPLCGEVKQMDVSKFRDSKKEVRLKCTCKCKHAFSVILERRLQARKQVFLQGVVLRSEKQFPVDILNISRMGLRIKTKDPLDIKLLDRVNIEFELDDATRSLVRKKMIARSIRKNEIGLEFVDRNHYDKLGPYLLFHFN